MTRIAIVEDNPDTLLLMKTMLSRFFLVDTYIDGDEAAEGLLNTPPDVILMDISLPKMSGIDVFNILRQKQETKDIPVIAFTTQKPKEFFINHGFDDYIQKPALDPAIIAQKIESCLSSQSLAPH